MRLVPIPGVLSPPSDSVLLASQLDGRCQGRHALDVGSGSGIIAIAAALAGACSVTAVDLSRRALVATRLNAWLNRVRVRVARGDLFGPVRGRRFDLITSNPPYLPSMDGRRRGIGLAVRAGRDGRAVLDRICAGAPQHLARGGVLLLVQSSLADPERSREALESGGLEVEELARQAGPLGPLARRELEGLRRQGLVERVPKAEELVVLEGRRP